MPQIDVSAETYEKIKDQLGVKAKEEHIKEADDMINQCFFFRAVTYHCVGRVIDWMLDGTTTSWIAVLEDASWVADSGRFMQAIKDGTLAEVEPVGLMYLNMGSVVDFFPWRHPLPTEQK
ncbi:MAG: hypothetical protein GY832_11780 [Chloroflexi bacterium]|nr:hypothetical protein [Chloroflexota bacterium]